MIAIFTYYLGPSATLPARIVASTTNGHRLCMSRWVAGDKAHTDDMEGMHRYVAQSLADKLDKVSFAITLEYFQTR